MSKFASRFFLLIFIFITAGAAEASKYRRLVNFEWEPIEGATSYEIELIPLKKESAEEKSFNFKTTKASWNGRLTPGKYLMRLRSRDYRGVPGDWSPQSDFHVGLDSAALKSPLSGSIDTNATEKKEIEFRWDRVGGADQYEFTLTSEDGKTLITQKLTEPKVKVEVPVAASYSWTVKAVNAEGIASESTAAAKFTLNGKKLEKVSLEQPETEFVREITWAQPEHATSYDVFILHKNERSKKYEKFKSIEKTNLNTLNFDSSWPGGFYKIAVRAHAPRRPSSDLAKMGFRVRAGDRSPAAEYTALVRKSIDRVNGWYGIASYLFTEVKFTGVNPEKSTKLSYNAIGGTGRLGLGWFNPNTPWGFLGILDMSGFTFEGKTKTFASAELNSVYRISMGDRTELRLQAGPYFKEQPDTIGDAQTQASEDAKIVSAGPHLGAEFWFSLTPKLGIQLNAHIYNSLLKIETPNDRVLEPSMSYQIGLLGSYRVTKDFTGLVGWAMREDRMKYESNPYTPLDPSLNFGNTVESTIVGNYLNFFAEWAF